MVWAPPSVTHALPVDAGGTVSATIWWQSAAQRRHSFAQSPHRAWCGACCSHSPAQSSQISAQSAQIRRANADFRPIHWADKRQMSAQSRQSLIQRTIRSSVPSCGMPTMSSAHVLHRRAHSVQAWMQSMVCCSSEWVTDAMIASFAESVNMNEITLPALALSAY